MGLGKTLLDITALIASALFGKALIAIGISGLIGGSVFVPIIVYNLMLAFESTREAAGIVTGVAAVVTFLVSAILTAIGIAMLIWSKKKGL